MARTQKTEKERALEFAVLLPVVFGVLALIGVLPVWFEWPWWQPKLELSRAMLIAGPPVCLFALILPGLWLRIFRLWMKLAEVMSWVMTRVILSIFFFVILTPYSLVLRLFGKRPLDRSWKDGKSSYWIDKTEEERSIARYGRQY